MGGDAGGRSWRTAGDLGGLRPEQNCREHVPRRLRLVRPQRAAKVQRPGGWNAPDYLLLGYLWTDQNTRAPTSFSPNEQYAQVSLWCLVTAP